MSRMMGFRLSIHCSTQQISIFGVIRVIRAQRQARYRSDTIALDVHD
jgi:hypothetical protein